MADYEEPYKNEISTTGASACSLSNHIKIDNAITELQSIIVHANNLLNKILGNDSPKANEPVPTNPTLNYILENTPSNLNDLEQEMHAVLDKINTALFYGKN